MRRLRNMTAALGALVLLATSAFAADPVFDGKGFSPHREFAGDLGFEHIDPLTGNVLLTFTDLVLPGNAGFDLRIQRTYNIKIYSAYIDGPGDLDTATPGPNDPAGLGWTMHFGKLINIPTDVGDRPVIEMPDGSSHRFFRHQSDTTSPPSPPRKYISRELWTLDLQGAPCSSGTGNCPLLRLPNGIRYLFSHGDRSVGPLYTTDIFDPFGNSVRIQYETYTSGHPAYVQWIDQSLKRSDPGGTDTRRVTFQYRADPTSRVPPVKVLDKIHFGSRTWTYTQEVAANIYTLLRSVTPPRLTGDPESPPWTFDYYGAVWPNPYLVKKVTTPNGGTVSYEEYQAQQFYFGSTFVLSPALKKRTTGGVDVPAGTWTYTFTQANPGWDQPVIATVSEGRVGADPPCRTTTYESWALGPATDEMQWRVGAIKQKTIVGGGALQTETYDWIPSAPISIDPEGGEPTGGTHVPLLQRRTLTRDDASHTTRHDYHTPLYNDYGHAWQTTESGPGGLTRVTQRTFYYSSGSDLSLTDRYVTGMVEEEGVRVDAGTTFVRSRQYDPTGFMREERRDDLVTKFEPDAGGNVRLRTHGSFNPVEGGHTTRFVWRWGVPQAMYGPGSSTSGVTVTRVIDNDSTIRSETHRGQYKTSFLYDGLFRLKSKTPPAGAATTWTYTDGRTVEQTRGASGTTSTLDGLGRVSATVNSRGVATDTDHDACGRVSYQSYPYQSVAPSTTPNIGTRFDYDGLDRLKVKTNPDASRVTLGYTANSGGIMVTVTDEENRVTKQLLKAFGTPEDSRLVSLTDGEDKTTSYSYNSLGSLTGVTPPGHSVPQRSWTYHPNGLVHTETHPENGDVRYEYYSTGLVRLRTDEAFGTTEFKYDGHNRLTLVNRPRSEPDTEIGYLSEVRSFLRHGTVRSEFKEYDGNNHLKRREDTVGGKLFVTQFKYDSRENLEEITYPMGGKVVYGYDSENRVTSVTDGGSRIYADRFAYHPSGGVSRYFSGNNIQNDVTYHPDRYWVTSTKSGAFFDMAYGGHDLVGNVTQTADPRLGTYGYTYDNVDRLKTATTSSGLAWGNLTFGYDDIGNRRFKTGGGQRTDYTYNASTNRLTGATVSGTGALPPPEVFGYDDNGSITSDAVGGYTYNADDMMASATVNSVTTTYQYDGDGLRKLRKSGATSTFYVHGLGNQVLSEMEQAGTGPVTVKRNYVYAGSRLVATVRPPTLAVSPEVLIFASVVGSSPPSQLFTVREASGGSLAWQATEAVSWLSLSPTSGAGTPAPVNVAVNTTGLAVGTYLGTIRIDAAGAAGSPRQVTVRLVVTNQAGLVVQPSSLDFDMTVGEGNPDPDALYAVVSGGPAVEWSATTSHSWINLSASIGTTPSTITVSVDGSDKRPGTHRGWIKIDGGSTPGSPRYVPIALVVRAGAGAVCADMSWFCEIFDDRFAGDLGGQGYWEDGEVGAQVVSDPRGVGQVAMLDPPPNEFKTGDLASVPGGPLVEGSEISVQVMTEGVAPESKQVGKIEFFTAEGAAWGKTGRTFAALRFGSALNLQYGPNIYQVLVDPMEPGRWYDVRVVFENRNIYAYVDGVLLYQTANPLAAGLPVQAFAMTGWDFPGAAYVDVIDGHGAPLGLVVEPPTLGFTGRTSSLGMTGVPVAPAKEAPSAPAVDRAYGALPLSFEANQGQAAGDVRFLARAQGYDVSLTPRDIVMSMKAVRDARAGNGSPVTLKFPGGNPEAKLVPLDELPGKSHYYIGKDPRRWRTNIPHYAKVRYEAVYPGVDLVVYGNSRRLEYDLILAPGVDPSSVRLAFAGTQDLRLEDGDLVLQTPAGEIRQLKPVVYQEIGSEKRVIDAEYLLADGQVGFRVAAYDRTRPLVLDPVLVYSTYLGGAGIDQGWAIAVDEDHRAHVTGKTFSANFPQANPWQGEFAGATDAFLTKLSADGSALVFSTYFGGAGSDESFTVVLDDEGNAYIGGLTQSLDFPQVSPIQDGPGGLSGGFQDGFLAKFDPSGQLVFSSFLGGEWQDYIAGLALDGAGGVYAAGWTMSSSFLWTPVTRHKVNAAYGWGTTAPDAFVARVLGPESRPTYLTLLNGNAGDSAFAITVDRGGSAYVAGRTHSSAHSNRQQNPFPVAPIAFQPTFGGQQDAFVTKLDPSGVVVNYSSYLGGNSTDTPEGIALHPACASGCEAYVAGVTLSTNFPTTPGAPVVPPSNVFATKVAPTGASLSYSTYLGGKNAWDIAVDWTGAAHVAGNATSASFPSVASCPERIVPPTGTWDNPYVVTLNQAGTALLSCISLGATAPDQAFAIALDDVGDGYVLAGTNGTDFPTTEGAFQRTLAGASDTVVFKLGDLASRQPQMQFASGAYRALEGDGEAVITVNRRGDLAVASSVYYRTSPGSATPGDDYQPREGRLTFGQGESALVFTVPIVGDSVQDEEDETVNLSLSDPVGGNLGFPIQAVLTIGEDDGLRRGLRIYERGNPAGPVWWRVLDDMPWLSFTATSGTGPAQIKVIANPTGLAPGTYTGTIVVDADANDSPQFVLVTFTVTP